MDELSVDVPELADMVLDGWRFRACGRLLSSAGAMVTTLDIFGLYIPSIPIQPLRRLVSSVSLIVCRQKKAVYTTSTVTKKQQAKNISVVTMAPASANRGVLGGLARDEDVDELSVDVPELADMVLDGWSLCGSDKYYHRGSGALVVIRGGNDGVDFENW